MKRLLSPLYLAFIAVLAVFANSDFRDQEIEESPHRILKKDTHAIFLVAEIGYLDEGPGSTKGKGKGKGKNKGPTDKPNDSNRPSRTHSVQLENGRIYTVRNAPLGWHNKPNREDESLPSGALVIVPVGATIAGGIIDFHGLSSPMAFDERDGETIATTNKLNRRLNPNPQPQFSGTRTVLAVHVKSTPDKSPTTSSAAQIGEYIFGLAMTLSSHYRACSYGKLNFVQSTAHSSIKNGVISVSSKLASTAGSDRMRDHIIKQVEATTGVQANQLADHVMLCMPSGTMGNSIAYAYVNSWLSVYNDSWCDSPSAQVHEVGHNLNLAHSGEASEEYDDQSGMMGYSYLELGGPRMCFNGAKSYQTGWYAPETVIMTADSEGPDGCFDGQLFGLANYEGGNSGHTSLIRVDVPNSGQDFFVEYLRKIGINSGVVEGGDRVLVTQTSGGDGNGYQTSMLLKKLNPSDKAFNLPGTGMEIKFVSTATVGGVQSAGVRVSKVGGTCKGMTDLPPSPTPLAYCTTSEGSEGVLLIVTIELDNYPEETTWSITNKCNGLTAKVASGGSYAGRNLETVVETTCVPDGLLEFQINDSWGDGICCTHGFGSYAVSGWSKEVVNSKTKWNVQAGEQFEFDAQRTEFGSFSNCPSPASGPTHPGPLVQITVRWAFDNYPEDVSWTLTSNCDTVDVVRSGGNYVGNSGSVIDEILHDMPNGEYTFVYSDTHGDGICCNHGNGYYMISMDGIDFEERAPQEVPQDVFIFGNAADCPLSHHQQQPKDPELNLVAIEVVITHDNYPDDVSWIIRDKCNGDATIQQRNDFHGQNGQTTIDTFTVDAGWFEFEITDSWGDGICCTHGFGSYHVNLDNVMVAEDDWVAQTGQVTYSNQIRIFGSEASC